MHHIWLRGHQKREHFSRLRTFAIVINWEGSHAWGKFLLHCTLLYTRRGI
ncbi:hypothetical protein CKAH01_03379 [Colletotrichum kahawae]|uniref:Uncharacterized protein n=1 Tax=Colletotrichum kahawae TaxID=34407 RepID=A0AAE0DCN7_COLKA|nr:hypothetical protein CKAH01_03379 [Colletotrichum kahawae]